MAVSDLFRKIYPSAVILLLSRIHKERFSAASTRYMHLRDLNAFYLR